MQNKNIIISIVVCVAIAGISFWGGMVYARKNITSANTSRQGQFGQGGFNQNSSGKMVQGARGGIGGGAVSGEIISKDDTSMTIKIRDGGSKIVFFSPVSKVEKTVDGTVADITVGKTVMITGTPNSDGSINAASIQIRPTQLVPVKIN
jgi:hypothetical protein